MKSQTEVRVCPFCGAKPEVETVTRKNTKLTATTIRCIAAECSVQPQLGPLWTMEKCVVWIWNGRRRKRAK